MSKTFTRVLCMLLVVCMVCALFVGCKKKDEESKGPSTYTYNTATTALGNNWNPHTWEVNSDSTILSYLSMGFVSLSIEDSENGVYQWVYDMATSIEDVTADNQADLDKYAVTLPEGKTSADVTEGYVYEIKLEPAACWQDGTPINADSYIYSMKQLLNPEMRNYRANLFYSGESAVAGGLAYYNAGAPIYEPIVPAYGEGEEGDYSYDIDAGIAAGELYVGLGDSNWTLYTGSSYNDLYADYGSYGIVEEADLEALKAQENTYGYIQVTEENRELVEKVFGQLLSVLFGITDEADIATYTKEALFKYTGDGDMVDYDATVGCYKVDDYTIRYVCQTSIEKNYFLTSCTDTWLVYEKLYEEGKDTTGELVTTNYGTSVETSMSYGPYKIESYQDGKQMVFVQNENWWGWEKNENGELVSYTKFLVDGKNVPQYQTTRVVYDVMEPAAAKQAFLKGELSDWEPEAEDLMTYSTSEQLYKVDETYTMSFFFNTGIDALKEMDNSKGNTNSIVMSNINFRKAFSLAIDREEWVSSTAGYKPAYATMNNLYFYDVYNDPTSSYRGSDEAMQAICNLYEVEYGEGTPYATLKDAYDSITGYNLTEAQALMKIACDELVADGLYTAGEDIHIRIGYKKGTLDTSDNQQVELIQKYLNAAVEGSGFGKVTLEPVGDINDRYGDTAAGEYAIGYGAWGGAAFYPFRNFQVYCDPDQYELHEAGCWDPTTETLKLNVKGEEVTKTWQEWSGALIGVGEYANEDNTVKLSITAQMEEAWLKMYYRIPLAGSTICSMLAYKVSYYTEEYNIMYDFGGLRLMTYNYNDAEWTAYVTEQGGTLSYE